MRYRQRRKERQESMERTLEQHRLQLQHDAAYARSLEQRVAALQTALSAKQTAPPSAGAPSASQLAASASGGAAAAAPAAAPAAAACSPGTPSSGGCCGGPAGGGCCNDAGVAGCCCNDKGACAGAGAPVVGCCSLNEAAEGDGDEDTKGRLLYCSSIASIQAFVRQHRLAERLRSGGW